MCWISRLRWEAIRASHSVFFTNTHCCWSCRVYDIPWLRKAPTKKKVKPKSPRGSDLAVPLWRCIQLLEVSTKAAAYLAPAPGRGWSHSTDAMKLNPPAFNRSCVMTLLTREAGGMPPVFSWSHLVPSTAAVPTGGWTPVRTDHFHSGDRDLQGLNVNECGHFCSSLLCFCYCVLVNALCCGEYVTSSKMWFSENICCLYSATDYLMDEW